MYDDDRVEKKMSEKKYQISKIQRENGNKNAYTNKKLCEKRTKITCNTFKSNIITFYTFTDMQLNVFHTYFVTLYNRFSK